MERKLSNGETLTVRYSDNDDVESGGWMAIEIFVELRDEDGSRAPTRDEYAEAKEWVAGAIQKLVEVHDETDGPD